MTKVLDFGCFVKLNVKHHREGLVHISNMSYIKILNSADHVKKD